jgi:hypothetical protein
MRYTFTNHTGLTLTSLGSHLRNQGVPGFTDGVTTSGNTVHIDTATELDEAGFDVLMAAMASYVDAPDAAPARAERDRLLLASDWTQLLDSPLSAEVKAAWATYRQALRDVTAQQGFPADVTWPEHP